MRGRTIAGRWLLIAAVALVAGPALSWAQGIDVEVTGVQLTPPAPRAGDAVTVRAAIRRTGTGGSTLKDPVAVEVEFQVAGEAKAFAVRKVTLAPEQSAGVEAAWTAQPGRHTVSVRVTRITTLKGQPLQDASPSKNEAMVQVLVVLASEPLRVAAEGGAAPPRPVVPLPPGPARPLSVFFGLRVNGGGYPDAVAVRWGEPAMVEWNLPGADGDALHLLVSRHVTPYCPSSIGNPWFDSLPGAGRLTPVPAGSVPLPVDRPEYLVDERYYLKGCLLRAGVPTGDETNLVVMNLADDPGRRELARHRGPPDLVVRDVRLLWGGADSGRLWITIADLNGSRAARASSFRYEVFFNDETAPRLRGTVTPEQWVGSGVPFLVTDPTGLVPTEPRGAAVVRVVVNGDRAYAETDYENDTLERYVGWQADMTSFRWSDGLQVLRVHEVIKVDEAPSWVVLGVRYTYTGHLRPADYLSLTVPTAGPDTVSCRGPGGLWGSPPGSLLPRGVNVVVPFLCVASESRSSFATDAVVATPRDGAGAPVAERRFHVVKRWYPLSGPDAPALPDLKVRVLSRFSARLRGASPHPLPVDSWGRPTTWYPMSAVGGRIDLRYGNWGRLPSREGVGRVFIWEGDPLTCGLWNAVVLPSSAVPATRPPEGRRSWGRSFPIPPLAPLEARTISLPIDYGVELSCHSHIAVEVTTPDIDASPADNQIGVVHELGMPPPETQWDELPQTDAGAWGVPSR